MTSPSHPVDLLVALDRSKRASLSDQLAAQISGAIVRGSLKQGSRLPASRMLAAELGISRGVVTAAYAQLMAQGYLETSARSVPRVAAVRPAPTVKPERTARVRLDFTMLSPDVALLPRGAWKRALIDAVQTAPLSSFDYGDPRGEVELRAALADILGRTRGLVAGPEQIIICQGTVQALDVACQTMVEHGARLLAIEEPCADEVRRCARRAGLDTRPLEVDLDGLRTDQLRLTDAEAALVTPAHQFPTGSVMTAARRGELASWLSVRHRFVIEDDYDAEFRYSHAPMAALQGAFPEQVLYIGSASKTFAPGLRLGWLVVPEHLIETASNMKWSLDAGSPSLTQLAFARIVVSGAFERHLVKARTEYKRRRAALSAGLAAEIPRGRIEGASAGMHLVLRLPEEVDADALKRAAARARVKVESVESLLSQPPRSARRLVLSYARLHPSRARAAARAVSAVIRAAHYEADGPLDRGASGPVRADRPAVGSLRRQAAQTGVEEKKTSVSIDLEAMHGMTLSEIYGPRAVEYLGVWNTRGWALRAYGIAFNRPAVRSELVEAAKLIAGDPLPPADDPRSSGAGFVVIHDSEDGCYVLVDWWVQIEMHEAIYFSPIDQPAELERMDSPVVACVYELGVIDHERRLWLDHVRRDYDLVRESATGDLGGYLSSPHLTGAI